MKIIFRFWPLLIVFCLWFIFASPYVLKGKVPFPSTYLVTNFGPWNAYGSYLGPVKNGATPDVISQAYPWKKLVIDSWKKGIVPLWNIYSFGGTPLLANYQSAALTPLNLLYFILPFVDAWSIQILLQPLLAGLFMYMFVRSLRLSREASVVSSIAFMFCGFITTWGVYGSLGYAILFLPLALWSIEGFYQTRKWYFTVALALIVPLSFLSGHFQTSLYFLLFVVAYSIFKFLTEKDLKILILNLLSILSGVLVAAPQLLPTVELYKESVRSTLFMKTEVIPWGYLPTLLAPDFFGNPVTRNDWFGHYAEWNAYVGLVPLLLGIYSLKRNKYVIFFAGFSAIVILLAFQTPILDFLIALKIPVLSTSAASRIVVLFSFSAAVLAGFGLDGLVSDIKRKKFNHFLILSIISGFMFAVLILIIGAKLFIPPDKISIAFSNIKLPILIFMAFVGFIVAGFFVKNKKMLIIVPILLIGLTGFDLIRFVLKWQPYDPRSFVYSEVAVSKFTKTTSGYDRAFGNFGQEMSVMMGIPGIEGYDPLYVGRFGEFSNAAQDGNYHAAFRSVALFSKNGSYTGKVFNFLGVKYIIHKVADGRAVWAFPYWEYPVDQFRTIYKDQAYEILENDKALPRAFVVSKYIVLADKRNILHKMFHDDTDLATSVILEDRPAVEISKDAKGSAKLEKYEPGEIIVETESSGQALLVTSEPFYPGWKAYVDAASTKIYRANYAFRAVIVPKGRHVVRFTYDPDSFKIGLALAAFGAVLTGASALYVWKKKFRS